MFPQLRAKTSFFPPGSCYTLYLVCPQILCQAQKHVFTTNIDRIDCETLEKFAVGLPEAGKVVTFVLGPEVRLAVLETGCLLIGMRGHRGLLGEFGQYTIYGYSTQLKGCKKRGTDLSLSEPASRRGSERLKDIPEVEGNLPGVSLVLSLGQNYLCAFKVRPTELD